MILELIGKAAVSGVVLCCHYDPGGAFIQPMNDPRPHDTAYPGQVPAMVQQGVDECPCIVALGRVYNHVSRFVDDDKVSVLVKDSQRDIFSQNF
jgi:hypothetical protein